MLNEFATTTKMFSTNTDILERTINGVPPEKWLAQPGDDSNHLLWIAVGEAFGGWTERPMWLADGQVWFIVADCSDCSRSANGRSRPGKSCTRDASHDADG